jgi:hypothetical protein
MPKSKEIPNIFRRAWTAMGALLALALILALLLHGCGDQREAEDAWISFGVLMDKIVDRGAWDSASHSYSGGALTVEGIKFSLDAPSNTNGGPSSPAFRLATLTVEGLPPSKDMRDLLSGSSRKAARELTLAKNFSAASFAFQLKDGGTTYSGSLQNVSGSGVALAPGGGYSATGPSGIFRDLSVGRFYLRSLSLRAGGPEGAAELKVGALDGEAVSLGGQEFLGYGDFPALLMRLKAQRLEMASLVLDYEPAFEAEQHLIVDTARVTGLDGLARHKTVGIRGVTYKRSSEIRAPNEVEVKITSINLVNLDGVELMRESFSERTGGVNPLEMLEAFQEAAVKPTSLAGFVSYPFSFDTFTVTSLDSYVDGMLFGFDRAEYFGPVRRHSIPSFKIAIDNFRAVLDPEVLTGDLQETARKLVFTFGYPDYRADLLFSSDYEPSSGTVKYNYWKLDVEGLFAASGTLELTGLTPAVVVALSKIEPQDLMKATFIPGFASVGFKGFVLRYDERNLVTSLIEAQAEEAGIPPDDFGHALASALSLHIDKLVDPSSYPKANDALAAILRTFVLEPKSLEIESKPVPTIDITSVMMGYLQGSRGTRQLFNRLNLDISVNEEEPVRIHLD